MSARLAPLTENAFVRALDAAEDPAEAGGKACNLNRMIGLGMNVPPGIVVTASAFRQFLNTAGLNAAISSIRRDSLNDLQDVAIAIQERIRASKVPAEILDPLLELRHSLLPHGRLIVRSSAVGEDSATASFAGQLDSFAGAATSEEIERALLSCWSSYWNERVLFYQQAKRVQLRGMGVIVQLLVESRISGVLFTQAPGDSARGGDLYAEFCAGPGEALVAGRVTPSRLRISRTDWQWTVEPGEENVSLDARHIESLARASVVLEMEFNAPQDIEWTVDGCDRLFLLQARPITAVAAAPRRVLWSNANVNENFPDVITPFLYSIAREGYYHYFRNLAIAFGLSSKRIQSMEYSFRHIIGVHHSRMYYNLTSIHSVLSQAPFGDSLSRFFNQFVGESQPETESRTAIESRWRSSIEVTKIAVHTTWQYMFFRRGVEEFEHRVDRFAESTRPEDLDRRSALDLRDDLRRFMQIRRHHWTKASLADAAAMVCYGVLRSLLNNAYPADGESALHNNLLKGLSGVVSVQPTIRLWELSRRILADPDLTLWFASTDSSNILDAINSDPEKSDLRDVIEEYLDSWGFRFSGELMLTVASFQENPVPLIDMLKSYLLADGPSPVEAIRKLESERRIETQRILNDLRRTKRLQRVPRLLQAPLVRLALHFTHTAIEMRERARTKQALLYNRCRRIALALGKKLAGAGILETVDDIFFLTYSELDEFLSGHAMFPGQLKAEISIRKLEQTEARGFSAPDSFTLAAGEYLRKTTREKPGNSEAGSEMSGIGACGGKVTAPAAILESVVEAGMLQQGDILVTRQTDPGWGPVFFLIRGLVVERGGMLSHGAIIAREFGLPCVVGVKDATRRIPQRHMLLVDGDRGNVQLL